jgi:predicted nucleic acid-binding protein
MIRYLVDTNVLVRLLDFAATDHLVAANAINQLLAQSDVICVSTQNLIEFWSVATRPANVNGLAWDTSKTKQQIEQLLIRFQFLPDPSDVLTHWLPLVAQHDIKGRRTHDARLIAVMLSHGVTHLLTFNTGDFASFTNISLVHPGDL